MPGGNHGEDVKEYYFYVDNLPTHSYQRYLYKYPQAEFPYAGLVAVNRGRSRHELEYELADTGVFDGGRYFDVEVEYAKARPEDILCRITLHNRSADVARLHVLPTLWFRNTWSWGIGEVKPQLARAGSAYPAFRAEHHQLGVVYLYAEPEAALLFCENETNAAHQTGWTGLVARLIQSLGQFDAASVLDDQQWPMSRPYRRLSSAPIPPL